LSLSYHKLYSKCLQNELTWQDIWRIGHGLARELGAGAAARIFLATWVVDCALPSGSIRLSFDRTRTWLLAGRQQQSDYIYESDDRPLQKRGPAPLIFQCSVACPQKMVGRMEAFVPMALVFLWRAYNNSHLWAQFEFFANY
jgi:hypothetical protein